MLKGAELKVERATKTETEADLESRARAALVKALPWLAKHKIDQQVTFTVKFGHAEIKIDGKKRESASGRVDILVSIDNIPTILLELKRPGLGITSADIEQGLSYARVLHPRPPLVVVTDGIDPARIFETHTGSDWTPVSKDGEALKALLDNVALVAADDMKKAVSTLLGNDPTLWITAARTVSESFIAERTADEAISDLPFLSNFLLPRKAVRGAIDTLDTGARLVVIEGGPLAGKSNALRALAENLKARSDYAVMLLDADSGIDLFHALADIWSAHFSWPLTPFEARHWTQQLSRVSGPALVLAVDDFDGTRSSFRRDLEALTSELFGDRIRIVLALDVDAAQRLNVASNGRTASILKRRAAATLAVGKLDDEEFADARDYLLELGIRIMEGGEHTPELRIPWVLRAMCTPLLAQKRPSLSHFVTLPSIPTLELLRRELEKPGLNREFRAHYHEIAQALFEDTLSGDQSTELRLEALAAYTVRRSVVRGRLGSEAVAELLKAGLLHEGRSEGGEAVFIAQFPIALAAELSRIIADQILGSDDDNEMARAITRFASSAPLGAVIVAQAIVEAATRNHTLDIRLLQALLETVPRRETLPPGTTFSLRMPNGKHVTITVGEGTMQVEIDGKRSEIAHDDLGSTTADAEAWTILSHLATLPMAADNKETAQSARFDLHLLLTIGSYPGVLVDSPAPAGILAIETHEFGAHGEIPARSAGVVEPITYAILLFFQREPQRAAAFLKQALDRESLPLMIRIHTALHYLPERSSEIVQIDKEIVVPAIGALLEATAPNSQ